MGRTKRQQTQDPTEVEPKPKRRKKSESPVAIADTLTELKEAIPALKTAVELPAQLPPPEPTHAERVRPTGPRKRDSSDPRNVYRGESIRIDLMPDHTNGDTYWIESTKPLPRHKQNLAIAAGFDPIGDADTTQHWQADKAKHHETGKDLSLLGAVLDDKSQRLGRGR